MAMIILLALFSISCFYFSDYLAVSGGFGYDCHIGSIIYSCLCTSLF